MKKLKRLNVIVMLIILASCSNKATIRQEVYYFDEEKTIVSSKKSYCDSVQENGYEISLLHGEQIEYYEDGKIRSKENYNFDQLDGLQFQFGSNGDTTSMVSFSNGVQDGISITYSYGKKVISNYSNGKLNGNYLRYTIYGENLQMKDTTEHGEYKMGKKEGLWIEADLTQGLNHRCEGKHIYTYENGIKNGYCRFLSGWEGMVVNGRMDGRWVNNLDSPLSIMIDNGELIAEEIAGKQKPWAKTRGYIWKGNLSKCYGHYVETDRVHNLHQEINLNFLEKNFREDNWESIETVSYRTLKVVNYKKHSIVDYGRFGSEIKRDDNILGRYYSSSKVGKDRNDSIIIDFRYNVILNLRVSKLDDSDIYKRKELQREGEASTELWRLKEAVNIREYLISSVQDTGLFEYQKVKLDSAREINCIFSFVSGDAKGMGSRKDYLKTNFYIDSQFNCYKKEDNLYRSKEITRGGIYKLRCVEKRYDTEENTLYLILQGIGMHGNWSNSEAWVINFSQRRISVINNHCTSLDEYAAYWGKKNVYDKEEYYSDDNESCRFMLEENEKFGIGFLLMEKIQAITEREFD